MLDRALKSPQILDARRGADRTQNAQRAYTTEQLRTQALKDHAAIMAAAQHEYRHYRRRRATAVRGGEKGAGPTAGRSRGLLGALGFLIPVLAAMAALVFLVFGYGLRLTGQTTSPAGELVTAGWCAAAVAALAALLGLAGLLVSAGRNRAVAYADHLREVDPAEAAARQAWHQALLERGMVPYLEDRLRGTTPPAPTAHPSA
ncbi:hypothetical protein [Streptomyces sp. NPDC058045]|uniref:hypothetical protein n=1 Tax=Streptomyces sp. NPDC058045 TaxID=3346311 RepID=UPI0036F1078F